MSRHIPVFEKFIQDLRAAWKELPDTEARMKKGQKLLEELVNDESMRKASQSWPSTEGRKNLLFHEDEECGFAINGVVRMPGRKGSIHDHAHAWTAYGVLDGSESLERFRRVDPALVVGSQDLRDVPGLLGRDRLAAVRHRSSCHSALPPWVQLTPSL